MKIRIAVMACLIATTSASANEAVELAGYRLDVADSGGVRTILSATSPVIELTGLSPSEIASKAQSCASKEVSMPPGTGTQLFENVDLASGLVSVNVNVQFFSKMMQQTAKSRLAIEARDGRFRMTHTDMWGGSVNSPYGQQKLTKIWGTGWEKSVTELVGVSEKIAACIKAAPTGAPSDW